MAESGIMSVVKIILRFILTIMGAISGYEISLLLSTHRWIPALFVQYPFVSMVLFIILFALLGFSITPIINWGLIQISTFFEKKLQAVGYRDMVIIALGLLLGLMIGNLLSIPFYSIPVIGFYISIMVDVLIVYLVTAAFLKRKHVIWQALSGILQIKGRFPSKKKYRDRSENSYTEDGDELAYTPDPKILDTSVLIDGRILEVAKAGFLEGRIILPRFILAELQGVADSIDPMRRARGRRGLSVVTDLQELKSIQIEIPEVRLRELERDKVDEALVVLGKQMGGKILTTDYNLNQISKIEGVSVLNVNDLANALKPMFLPGEIVRVEVTRPGKEAHQGIAYLDDGTMLVVEDGERSIGKQVTVMVTSMLQTAAGRMVFGKIKRD